MYIIWINIFFYGFFCFILSEEILHVTKFGSIRVWISRYVRQNNFRQFNFKQQFKVCSFVDVILNWILFFCCVQSFCSIDVATADVSRCRCKILNDNNYDNIDLILCVWEY